MLWKTHELIILAAALVGFLAAMEMGFRLGRRKARLRDDGALPHLSALQGAVLGLIGLLFGFSLTMAVNRYEERKALVLEESNDIGTLWLRSAFLPAEMRQKLAGELLEYVQARIDFHEAGLDEDKLQNAFERAENIQAVLWSHATRAATEDPKSIPTGLFIQTLNDVIDDFEERRVALDNHVPDIVMLLLFATSVIGLGFVAFSSGLSGRRRLWTSSLVALLFGLVLVIILDIDRPRRGLVLVGQESMLRLRDTIAEHIAKGQRAGP